MNMSKDEFMAWWQQHYDAARMRPNQTHKVLGGWYLYYASSAKVPGMMYEIRHEMDEDTGREIGWFVDPISQHRWNDYGDPLATKRDCIEYIKHLVE